jgi:hypothetical protein
MKSEIESHGKSFSSEYPKGRRRKKDGKELAPRSLRRNQGKVFLSECSEAQLEKAGVV